MSAKLDVSLDDLIKSNKPARTSKTVKTGPKAKRTTSSKPASAPRSQSTSRNTRPRSTSRQPTRTADRSRSRESGRPVSRSSSIRSSRTERRGRSSSSRGTSRERDYRPRRELRDYDLRDHDRESYRDYREAHVPTYSIPPMIPKPVEPVLRAEGTIMVSNLRSFITESHIRNVIFRDSGDIKTVNMVYDSQGNPAGSALVVFYDTEDAKKAVAEFDGAIINDTPMSAKLMSSFNKPESTTQVYHPHPEPIRDYEYGYSNYGRRSRERSPRRDSRDYDEYHRSTRKSPIRERDSYRSHSQRRSPSRSSGRSARRSMSSERTRESRPARSHTNQRPRGPSKPSSDSLDAELDAYQATREDENNAQ